MRIPKQADAALAAAWVAILTVAMCPTRGAEPRGPKLEGDVYKCAVRMDWKDAAGKEVPDLSRAEVRVTLITLADEATPDEPSQLCNQDLKTKVYREGVVLFDLPVADLYDEHRQVLEVSVEPRKDFRYRLKHGFPVSRKTVAMLPMPIVAVPRAIHTREIQVQVLSGLDGKPLPDEGITCVSEDIEIPFNETRTTGADGTAVFALDDDRSYRFVSRREKGAFPEVTLKQEEIRTIKQPILLRAPAPRLMGRLLVKGAGGDFLPLEGAPAAFGASASIRTPTLYKTWFVRGEMGRGAYAVYDALEPGEYHVHLPGVPPYSEYVVVEGRDFTVDASTKTPIRRDLVLKRAAPVTLAVAVLDADGGKPVAGARVRATRLAQKGAHSAETDAEGQVSFRQALEGDYVIQAEALGFHRRDEVALHLLGDHRQEVRLVRTPPPRPKP